MNFVVRVFFFINFVQQILQAHTEVAQKSEMYVPYNILPLDPDSQNQAIMRYPEVSFPYIIPYCWFLFYLYKLYVLL